MDNKPPPLRVYAWDDGSAVALESKIVHPYGLGEPLPFFWESGQLSEWLISHQG